MNDLTITFAITPSTDLTGFKLFFGTSSHSFRRYVITGVDQYGQFVIEEIQVPIRLSRQAKRYLAVKRQQHKRALRRRKNDL